MALETPVPIKLDDLPSNKKFQSEAGETPPLEEKLKKLVAVDESSTWQYYTDVLQLTNYDKSFYEKMMSLKNTREDLMSELYQLLDENKLTESNLDDLEQINQAIENLIAENIKKHKQAA